MSKPTATLGGSGLSAVHLSLLDAANIGYFKWHQDPSRCTVSAQCWALIDVLPGEQGGYSDWCAHVHCRADGFDWAQLKTVVTSAAPEPLTLQLESLAPNGTSRLLQMTARFSDPAANGTLDEIVGVVTAIHPQSSAVEALAEANSCFDAIADGSKVGLWHRNLISGTDYWSKRFWELTDIHSDDPNPPLSFFYQHVHPDDLDRLHSAQRQHLEHRDPYDIELRLIGSDNKERWFNVRGQAVWDNSGRALRLAGSLEDITLRKAAEHRVDTARKFQKLMMNTMDDLLFVKDEQFRIQEANSAFLRLYPESIRDQVIGSTTLEEYDEIQREEFLAEDRRALAEGSSETEEVIFFPNGEQRNLWTKKVRFHDQFGSRYILGYGRDITDLKQTERALIAANSELEEFAYRVSHDLRSPLESAVHLLDYLAEALSRGAVDESKDLLGTVQSSLSNLNSMAKDILNVHRIRHGELSAEVIDVEARVEHILKRHRLDHGDMQLSATYQLDAVPVVDAYGLDLMLENLISNAVKYRNPQQGNCRVAVDVRCDRRYLKVAISDNGLGIPAGNRPQLFGMFQRFHPRESFGSGLGLYMTKQWAERMGGGIEVAHLDPGTRFTVTIPQHNLNMQ